MSESKGGPEDKAAGGEYVITFVCPDGPGIVHDITGALLGLGGNVTESQQFVNAERGRFYMRVQVSAPATAEEVRGALAQVASARDIEFEVDAAGRRCRTLLLASKEEHCVNDLLFQRRRGYVPIDVPLVLANHPDAGPIAEFYGVDFEYLPISGPGDKEAFEARVLEAVDEHDIELVVLARYMQILSPELSSALAGRCINIHHSFLPGFKGANPYRQAHERGVKQIGATAHFVTADLDEGPIIEQEVARVDHTRSPAELRAIGQDTECRALRQAVTWFAESRVLLDGRRTIVFT
ncbi:formyltetrahydrofolate deformylase [Dietzia sp.]|uniref:formyltetrahydrofolate deformylase n=1 Tax=Dietzia sp. TaxID=1871616 RepID=UPI002FD895DB